MKVLTKTTIFVVFKCFCMTRGQKLFIAEKCVFMGFPIIDY